MIKFFDQDQSRYFDRIADRSTGIMIVTPPCILSVLQLLVPIWI